MWAQNRKKAVWAGTLRAPDLTDDEAKNTKAALVHLRTKYGGVTGLARALGLNLKTVKRTLYRSGRPGAGMALRVSRLAHVPIEEVLTGKWPGDRCPHCGRG
jgi:hypothetical protein